VKLLGETTSTSTFIIAWNLPRKVTPSERARARVQNGDVTCASAPVAVRKRYATGFLSHEELRGEWLHHWCGCSRWTHINLALAT
jgi:hypothetical protein